jgi:hypothetical protein
MKTPILIITALTILSCKKEQSQQTAVATKEITPNECYQSIYEEDTIILKLNTSQPKKVVGDMTMKVADRPVRAGKIAGGFRGDTLFVSYTFTQGGNKNSTFKNPLALLKRDNSLILGQGEIETTMGASYFVKGKPIDFEHVKYKFAATDCAEH